MSRDTYFIDEENRTIRADQGTVVIKVGTSSLIRPEHNCLNLSSLANIVELVRDLRNEGYNVILVSSGAVGVGCQRLGIVNRPSDLPKKQALAAVGQVHLMRYYDDLFSAVGLTCSQVLLTLENLSSRGQHKNAANTFRELMLYGVVPVVNENDTVAVEQLRIGDNDTLSAQVATLVHAKWLFLLTDVDALYTANPSTDPNAIPIRDVPSLWDLEVDTSTRGTEWGTGGMATKLTAARIATAGGCNMAICHFAEPKNVLGILHGDKVGTVFRANVAPVKGSKRWLLSTTVKGEVWLDAGAVRAVTVRRCSLFSAGVVATRGDFAPQDTVRICDHTGREFARGLSNYSREDIERVKGMASREFIKQYGDIYGQEEIIHRGSICLLMITVNEDKEGDDTDEDGVLSPSGISRSSTPSLNAMGNQGTGVPGLSPNALDDEDAVRERLQALTQRAEDDMGAWRAELEAAVAAERNELMAAAGVGGLHAGGEDVNEEGWLPK